MKFDCFASEGWFRLFKEKVKIGCLGGLRDSQI